MLRRLADDVSLQFPVFQGVELQELRGGLPTMMADGEHVLGAAAGLPGLYVLGGCCVGGLSTAPALGELLAELITEGHTSLDIGMMAPDRAATGLAEDVLKECCRLQYAHHYWSPQSLPTALRDREQTFYGML